MAKLIPHMVYIFWSVLVTLWSTSPFTISLVLGLGTMYKSLLTAPVYWCKPKKHELYECGLLSTFKRLKPRIPESTSVKRCSMKYNMNHTVCASHTLTQGCDSNTNAHLLNWIWSQCLECPHTCGEQPECLLLSGEDCHQTTQLSSQSGKMFYITVLYNLILHMIVGFNKSSSYTTILYLFSTTHYTKKTNSVCITLPLKSEATMIREEGFHNL